MKRFNNNTNSYIRVTSIKDIETLLGGGIIADNLDIPFDEFIEKLKEFEHNRKYKGNSRVFVLATFLLPENFHDYPKQEFIKKLAEHLFEDMPSVPWFAREEQKGKGLYIHLYFSERPFYADKHEVVNYAKSTTYKSTKTGRICKSHDPYAVIYKNKGDILSSSQEYFGKKYNKLWKRSFNVLMSEIRDIFDVVLNKFDIRAEEKAFIHKVNYSHYDKNTKINAIIKNNKLSFIEDILNNTYYALKIGHFIQEKEVEFAFNRLVYEIRDISNRDFIKYRHLKIPTNIFQDRYKLQDNLHYLETVCINKIILFTKKYIGII